MRRTLSAGGGEGFSICLGLLVREPSSAEAVNESDLPNGAEGESHDSNPVARSRRDVKQRAPLVDSLVSSR